MRCAYDPFPMGDLNDLTKHTKHDLHRRLVSITYMFFSVWLPFTYVPLLNASRYILFASAFTIFFVSPLHPKPLYFLSSDSLLAPGPPPSLLILVPCTCCWSREPIGLCTLELWQTLHGSLFVVSVSYAYSLKIAL